MCQFTNRDLKTCSLLQRIAIYRGEGVDRRLLSPLVEELKPWPTTFLTPRDILETSWEEETSLLLFPGGRDVPFHKNLQGTGNQRIRKYVEHGGSFLGICAGAYYGCSQVEFDRGMPLEVLGDRELRFFPGTGKGPTTGPGSFRYNSESGAKAVLLLDLFAGTLFRSYCNGGCYFPEANRHPEVTVLGNYLDLGLEECPAAVIHMPVGKGQAALSGVHLELSASYFEKNTQMHTHLKPYEAQRKRLFRYMLAKLGLLT